MLSCLCAWVQVVGVSSPEGMLLTTGSTSTGAIKSSSSKALAGWCTVLQQVPSNVFTCVHVQLSSRLLRYNISLSDVLYMNCGIASQV